MSVSKHSVLVVSANLAADPAFSLPLNGILHSITYVKNADGAIAFTDGVDFTISNEETTEEYWREDDVNATETLYPRPLAQKKDGTLLLYETGNEVATEGFLLSDQRVKFVVASPGTLKRGTFLIHLRDAGKN